MHPSLVPAMLVCIAIGAGATVPVFPAAAWVITGIVVAVIMLSLPPYAWATAAVILSILSRGAVATLGAP